MNSPLSWAPAARKVGLPLIGALIGALLGLLVAVTTTPTYTATSTQYFVASGIKTPDQLVAMNTVLMDRSSSYIGLVTTESVLSPVVSELGLSETTSDLASHVSATISPETLLLSISASDTDPQRAAKIAKAVADSTAAYIPKVEDLAATKVQLSLVTVTEPTVPAAPSGPSKAVDALIGLAAGALAGYMVSAWLRIRRRGRRAVEEFDIADDGAVTGDGGEAVPPMRREGR